MKKLKKIPPFRAPRAVDSQDKEDSKVAKETIRVKTEIPYRAENEVVETKKSPVKSAGGAGSKEVKPQKKVARSLTDAEYEEIFDAVLKQAMNDSVDLNIQPKCIDKLLPGEDEENSRDPAVQRSFDLSCELDEPEIDFDHFDLENMPDEIKSEFADFNSRAVIPGQRTIGTLTPVKSNLHRENTSTPVKKKISQSLKKDSALAHGDRKSKADDKNKKVLMKERKIEETATWVQCSKKHCMKWRFLANIHDPATLPDIWTCAMNDDPLYNSCELPEQAFDEEEHNAQYIFTRYTEGSLVWARMAGYPWWPAMVEIDPDFEDYFECKEFDNVASHYHVVFFDDRVSRAWVHSSSLMPFTGNKEMPKMNKKQSDFQKSVMEARERALEAEQMSIKDRLMAYSFASRFKGRWGKSSSQEKKNEKGNRKRGVTGKSNVSGNYQVHLPDGLDVLGSQSKQDLMNILHDDSQEDIEMPKKKVIMSKKARDDDSQEDIEMPKKKVIMSKKARGLPKVKSGDKGGRLARTVGSLKRQAEAKFSNPKKTVPGEEVRSCEIKLEADENSTPEMVADQAKNECPNSLPSQKSADKTVEGVKDSPSQNTRHKVKKFSAPVIKKRSVEENNSKKSHDPVVDEKTLSQRSQNSQSQKSEVLIQISNSQNSTQKGKSANEKNTLSQKCHGSQSQKLTSSSKQSSDKITRNSQSQGNESSDSELDLDLDPHSSQILQSAQMKMASQTMDEDSEPLDFEE